MTLKTVLEDFLIVGVALAICSLLIWVFTPGRLILPQPSRDSKWKLTGLAVIGSVLALVYFLVTDWRISHLRYR